VAYLALFRALKRLEKGCKRILKMFVRNFVRQIHRNLSGKQAKNLKNNSLKLLGSKNTESYKKKTEKIV
tara:strand:+ start:413 stop:619 length:207 start_codon:yes stop_codon:yes gene_type:complete